MVDYTISFRFLDLWEDIPLYPIHILPQDPLEVSLEPRCLQLLPDDQAEVLVLLVEREKLLHLGEGPGGEDALVGFVEGDVVGDDVFQEFGLYLSDGLVHHVDLFLFVEFHVAPEQRDHRVCFLNPCLTQQLPPLDLHDVEFLLRVMLLIRVLIMILHIKEPVVPHLQPRVHKLLGQIRIPHPHEIAEAQLAGTADLGR